MKLDWSIGLGKVLFALTLAASLFATGCSTMQLGTGGSAVSGSAGGAGTQGESKQLVKCAAPVATVALAEEQGGYGMLVQYGLPSSPLPLLRLILQQTGCFRVVDRAAGLRAAERELELAKKGMLDKNKRVRKGRVLSARYTLTPRIIFSESNAGGGGAGLIGLLPFGGAALIGGLVGSIKFKEAQTVIFLTDNETTEQIGAAEGSAKSTDMGAGGLLLGGLGIGGAGGWSNTNEGKVVAAALLDAVNKLVPHIRSISM